MTTKLSNKTQINQDQINERNKDKTWPTFTYYSPIVRKITNLFKHTNEGISFKNTNMLQQLTKPKIISNTQEQDKSGIYNLNVKHAKCHTLDRQVMVLNRGIRNISDI